MSTPAARSSFWSDTQLITPAIKRQQVIEKAAEYCVSLVQDGVIDVTAGQVAQYFSKSTWQLVSRKWRPSRCRWLKEAAQKILAAKERYHQLSGMVAVAILGPAIGHRAERELVKELAENIPLPGDAKFTAVARGLRITGVGMCVAQDIPLQRCACFGALATDAGAEGAKAFLASRGDEWMRNVV